MKYTVITGATGGIGRALAMEYARHGHPLILLGRDSERLNQIVEDLNAIHHQSYITYSVDLTDIDTLTTILEEINERYALECIINNAGIGIFEAVDQIEAHSVEKQLAVNVQAPILITTSLLANVRRNNGSLIFLCSILSDLPNVKSSVYVATKHGLLGFANTIRLEHPNLHVLTVHPVTVRTGFFQKELEKQRFILEPTVVARKTYRAHKRRRRRLNLPRSISLLRILYLLFPRLIDRINAKYFTNK